MNKMILIQSLAVFSVLFFSCDKTDNCPDSENYTNSGIIIDNASVENNCVSVKNRGNYIITNQQEYDSIEVVKWNDTCDASLNPINFNAYSLLGMYQRGTCRVNFERNVSTDSINKKYIYSIKVNECGNCKTNYEHMNWVLVPKIPDNWTVEFISK
ncbi:MAG: hypothetical protein WCZ21_03885 [Bacteroidales bacterium]|jgi:hypothetical protein